jgi:N4-gp56 family major capsid protein
MADWSYGPNAPEAARIWSARLFKQAITKTIAWKLANISSSVKSEENIVQILDDTSKGPGQNITYDLIAKLSGAGVQGDNEIAGGEESLVSYTTSMNIDQLRHSVKIKGAMSQQRVPIAMRETSKVRLGDWWASEQRPCIA